MELLPLGNLALITSMAVGGPPLPPEPGTALQVIGPTGLQKAVRPIDFKDRQTALTLRDIVQGSMTSAEEKQAAILARLEALTSEAPQDDILTLAKWFEENFF